jgi:hypothetical protein
MFSYFWYVSKVKGLLGTQSDIIIYKKGAKLMKVVEGALIKNTTKKERTMMVETGLALGSIEAVPVSGRVKELSQKYIDGEMEVHEIIEILNAEFRATLSTKESQAG